MTAGRAALNLATATREVPLEFVELELPSKVNLESPDPLSMEVIPETRLMDGVVRVVTEAMTKQQCAFLKMFEDRYTSQCWNEAKGEKARNESGKGEDVVVTVEA